MKRNILYTVSDLILLNLLWVLFSLPIFTIGASTTALYSITLKQTTNQAGYILRPFISAFKENFKKSTISFFIVLIPILVFLLAFIVFPITPLPFLVSAFMRNFSVILIVGFSIATVYVFPLLGRYDNTVKNTFRNSFLLGYQHFFKTIAIIIITFSPIILFILFPQLLYFIFTLVLFILVSIISLVCSKIMISIFNNYDALK